MHLDLSSISAFAVPTALVPVLAYLMQLAKPLLERVPGIRPQDVSHDQNLRVCYGTVAFLLVLGYELLTGSIPGDAQGWVNLYGGVFLTAVAMTSGGHALYRKLVAGKVDSPAYPATYPPAFDPTSQLPSTPSATS